MNNNERERLAGELSERRIREERDPMIRQRLIREEKKRRKRQHMIREERDPMTRECMIRKVREQHGQTISEIGKEYLRRRLPAGERARLKNVILDVIVEMISGIASYDEIEEEYFGRGLPARDIRSLFNDARLRRARELYFLRRMSLERDCCALI